MISIIKLRILRLKDEIIVLIIMSAMALGFTAMFGASFDSYKPTVLIVNNDNSIYSENLLKELKEVNEFNFIDSNMNEAVERIEEGNVLAALVINENFEDLIEFNNNVAIDIMKSKEDVLILSLQEIVESTSLKIAGGTKIADITAEFIKSQIPDVDNEQVKLKVYNNLIDSWKYKAPINVSSTAFNTNADSGYDGLKHSMIGFFIFFSMYTIVFGVGTILDDKKYKTWQRMLISPVSKPSILGGTIFVTYLLGAFQMLILMIGAKYLFNIDLGNSMSGIVVILAAFVFTVTSLGLLLSGIVKTNAQLSSIAPLLLTSTSMLGGCMWPLEIVNNKVLLFIAELTPQKWAVQGMENIISKGMGFQSVLFPTAILLAMGVLFFGIGVKITKFE